MTILPFSFLRVNQAIAIAIPILLDAGARAADWPRYRGPDLNGISVEAGLRTSGEAPILWKAEVGLGYSAPVVAGGRAVITGHDGEGEDSVFCFDEKTGEEIWSFAYPQPLGDLYFQGGTTGTPTLEGDRVYHLARRGELYCLEADSGKVVWKKNLMDDLGYTMPTWGFTGSPLLWDEGLFLNAGDSGVRLDPADGSVIWKSIDEEAGYSAPYPLEREGRKMLIFSNKRSYTCVDAASGIEVWSHRWMTRYGVNAADPVLSGDSVFISSGYGKGAALLQWKSGSAPVVAWQSRDLQAQMNAPVLINGHLYGIHGNEGQDGTGLRCLEMATGNVKWTETSVGHGALMAVKGMLLVLTEEGELQVAPASSSEYKPAFVQKVLEPRIWTVPVFANGRAYCRNAAGTLVVLGMKEGE